MNLRATPAFDFYQLPLNDTFSSMVLYADDTTLYDAQFDLNELVKENLQKSLIALSELCKQNGNNRKHIFEIYRKREFYGPKTYFNIVQRGHIMFRSSCLEQHTK